MAWVDPGWIQCGWVEGLPCGEPEPVVPIMATFLGDGGGDPVHDHTVQMQGTNDLVMLVAMAFMETRRWDH